LTSVQQVYLGGSQTAPFMSFSCMTYIECITAPSKQVDGNKVVEQILISKSVSSADQTRILE